MSLLFYTLLLFLTRSPRESEACSEIKASGVENNLSKVNRKYYYYDDNIYWLSLVRE